MAFHLFTFEDFGAFLNETGKPDSCWGQGGISQVTGMPEWYGSSSFAEASRLAVEGVPASEIAVRDLADGIKATASKAEAFSRFEYDVCGDDVDVSRFLSGEPENMMRYTTEERQGGKILSILIQGGASSTVGLTEILNRGAAILALTDILETAGYRVELQYASCAHVYGKGEYVTVQFALKRSQDGLDVTRLTYSLCCASMFRRHVWKWRETLPKVFRYQMGWMQDVTDETRPSDVMQKHLPHDVYIGKDYTDFLTLDSARAWIANTLRSIGIEQE